MRQASESRAGPEAPSASASHLAGRYVYCVARATDGADVGEAGIAGSRVYAVAHRGLRALVHDCPAQPYQSGDAEVAAAWVLAHHRVVEAAWKRWEAVLPLAFNTIIAVGDGRTADENVVAWLRTEYDILSGKLDALAGKAEYGVQVFWDPDAVARDVAEASPEVRRLRDEMASRPRGAAYMYRQRLEGLLKKEIEARAAEVFHAFYGRLARCADSVCVEKARRSQEGLRVLMGVSCLVSRERFPGLAAELDRISGTEGYAVRLVGPLPPYSFC